MVPVKRTLGSKHSMLIFRYPPSYFQYMYMSVTHSQLKAEIYFIFSNGIKLIVGLHLMAHFSYLCQEILCKVHLSVCHINRKMCEYKKRMLFVFKSQSTDESRWMNDFTLIDVGIAFSKRLTPCRHTERYNLYIWIFIHNQRTADCHYTLTYGCIFITMNERLDLETIGTRAYTIRHSLFAVESNSVERFSKEQK